MNKKVCHAYDTPSIFITHNYATCTIDNKAFSMKYYIELCKSMSEKALTSTTIKGPNLRFFLRKEFNDSGFHYLCIQ